MEGKFVTVKEFAGYFQFEQLTGDEESLKRVIELTDTNRPGLELAGFFDYSQAKRLVILGDKEIAYIASMSEEAQKRSFDFLTRSDTPAVRKRPTIRSSTSSPGSMRNWPVRSPYTGSCS